jgi:hypothetical protein
MQCVKPKAIGWGDTIKCVMLWKKMLEAIPNDAMTRHAKSHVLEPKPMHDIKQT